MANRDNPKKKLGAPPQPPHVSELILGSLKPRTGRETSCWIAGLVDDATAQELAENSLIEDKGSTPGSAAAYAGPVRPSAVSFVDHLFDFFQQIEFDFNKTVAGSDCVVSIDRPTYFNEKVRVRFQQQETVRVFRGRISTRYWTLIIRAHNDIVEGWVMPVEQVFGFRPDDTQYPAFLVIEPTANKNGQPCWRVNKVEIAWDQTRLLAKRIFAALIRIARGEAPQNEPFRLSAGVERAFSDSGAVSYIAEPSMLAKKPTDAAPPLERAAAMSPLPASPLPTPKTKQTLRGTRKQSSAGSESSLDSIVELLNDVLNRDLQKLTQAGADAFARQDMIAVDTIYRRAVRVKELQDQLITGIRQWKQAVKQAMET